MGGGTRKQTINIQIIYQVTELLHRIKAEKSTYFDMRKHKKIVDELIQ